MVQSSGEDMKGSAILLEKGILRSYVSQLFQPEEIAQAHLQVESGKTRGKIILLTNHSA